MSDLLPLIAEQRLVLADVLESLTSRQWNHQSLCDRWTNRQVAAHVSMGFNVSMPSFAVRMIKAKGNFNAATDTYARSAAAGSTAELIDCIRRNANHRFKPPGNGFEAPLTDVVLHTIDICRPLGLTVRVNPSAWPTILEFLVSRKAQKFFGTDHSGLAFAATDLGWSHGSGPSVSGPVEDIALVFGKRRIDVRNLTGDGLATVVQRRT
jgi:uncharacterized protein (TIGR03083 family)